VSVVRGRDAGADVQELPDARLAGQVTHRAGEELPVGPGPRGHARIGCGGLLGGLPVSGVVVLAAQPVVINPGLVSDARVEGGVIVPGARSAARTGPAPPAAGNHGAKVARRPATADAGCVPADAGCVPGECRTGEIPSGHALPDADVGRCRCGER
jgi:hypothetical protein